MKHTVHWTCGLGPWIVNSCDVGHAELPEKETEADTRKALKVPEILQTQRDQNLQPPGIYPE